MQKKQTAGLICLFAATYMVSYITRINYGTIISAMVSQTGFSKDSLSMALTGSFITYGVGQIISGYLGDRISPKKLISLGLLVTVAMNILLPLCGDPWRMCAVWCVNGFAQSFMWPPLVRIMSNVFSENSYKMASVWVSAGSSVGTVLLYLFSPVVLLFLPWKGVFWISAACGAVMLVVWHFAAPTVAVGSKTADIKTEKQGMGVLINPMMLAIMGAIVLMGMLRDGVTTWMPSYISETYQLGNSISILSGVFLPLFSVGCFFLASYIYGGRLKSPVTCAVLFFMVGAGAALGLFVFSDASVFSSALLSALLAGCMHGVNLMLISMIPPFFKGKGNVSFVSGMLNAGTYVGSAVSTYGIARLSESIGWRDTVFVWFLIALCGTIACIVAIPGWKKRFMQRDIMKE